MRIICILCLLLFAPVMALPQDKEAQPEEASPEQLDAQLKYQHGQVILKNGLATLTVPENFKYLDPEQSDLIITKVWGNPPRDKTLGMLFPSAVNPFTPEAWGVIITYEEEGYVKDDEAKSLDYGALLKQMKEGTLEANKQRQEQGYEPIELIGWAAPPHYDQANHKLYWAKELKFGDSPEHTLNYNIRALGRRGVLVLNAVSAADQLPAVEAGMKEVLQFVAFNEGHRYTDYVPGTDKVAAYGIGALIAGKIAAKVGLFKLLLGALVAAKKFVLLGLVGAGAFLRKLFGRKSRGDANQSDQLSITK